MADFTDFHIALESADGHVRARLTIRDAGAEAPSHPEIRDPLRFDNGKLLEYADDADGYGRVLTKLLFNDKDLCRAFNEARAIAEKQEVPIRFRLQIAHNLADLHALRWETLRDPDRDHSRLFDTQRMLFSRYLATSVRASMRPRVGEQLTALAVVANPSNLAEMHTPLAGFDTAAEVSAAWRRLAGFDVTVIGDDRRATLDNVLSELQRRDVDVLYMVCHGVEQRPGEPRLVLEDENGAFDVVDGLTLLDGLRGLQHRPGLIVLASCSSGGADGRASALSRIGPRLAVDIGIPAIVAMQGDVAVDCASQFLEVFFTELRRHGFTDEAIAAARYAVRDHPHWWRPVLYTRFPDARIWSDEAAGRARSTASFSKWESLLEDMSNGTCMPIVGFGVYEQIFGREDHLAGRWAQLYQYPFREDRRDELPQIAQYLSVAHNTRFPSQMLQKYFREEIRARFGEAAAPKNGNPDEIITQTWQANATQNDPYRILARIPSPVYLTTNVATTMEAALREVGAVPISGLSRWNDGVKPEPIPASPQATQPVVFHLFGRIDQPNSIVITEDNYFDYLMSIGRDRRSQDSSDWVIPWPVRTALNSSSLLFLGFQITDWNFRTMLRSFRSQGESLRDQFTNVAVQVDPHVSDPEMVLAYLERYLHRDNITILRGSVRDFIEQLVSRWQNQFNEDLRTRNRM